MEVVDQAIGSAPTATDVPARLRDAACRAHRTGRGAPALLLPSPFIARNFPLGAITAASA